MRGGWPSSNCLLPHSPHCVPARARSAYRNAACRGEWQLALALVRRALTVCERRILQKPRRRRACRQRPPLMMALTMPSLPTHACVLAGLLTVATRAADCVLAGWLTVATRAARALAYDATLRVR